MKVGIVGLPQSGKRTLFSILACRSEPAIPSERSKPVPGAAHVRDSRFEALDSLYRPVKSSPAKIELELLADLDRRSIQDGSAFRDIARLDALCLVIRAFEDDSVYHVDGSVDPERDLAGLLGEFILHDLLFIEKRLERIALNEKKGKGQPYQLEKAVLQRFRDHLEKDLPLRTLDIPAADYNAVNGYPFITLKQLVVALNQSEEAMGSTDLVDRIAGEYRKHRIEVMQLSAKIEAEIASLDSEEECREFMEALAIEEPSINRLSRLCMSALNLISFFTVGRDEVRQWLIPAGAFSPQAAGVIHSDLERGFIRAEVMKHDELLNHGGEQQLKRLGKCFVTGRDYQVEDGDVISFLFNV